MNPSNRKKPYPIIHYVRLLVFLSFLALALDLVISVTSMSLVKQQSTNNVQDTADLYVSRIDHDFAYINHYMGWTLANDETITDMNDYPDNSTEFLKAQEKLFKRFTELTKNYEQEYNFFYYLKSRDLFRNCAPMGISYGQFLELKQQIRSLTEDKGVYENYYSKWTPLTVRGISYIVNIVPYHDRYLIGLVSADNMIRPLRQINLGASGYASLVDEEGGSLSSTQSGSPPDARKPFWLDLLQAPTVVDSSFSNATFTAELVIHYGAFEKIMIVQLLIMLLFFLVTCTLSAFLFLFRKQVLGPVKSFSYNLARMYEDGDSGASAGSRIIELEQANAQFRDLVRQLKKYKIEVYEQELEKRRIQLDYMKLQINPHFFLNCLTSIYSMAQMEMHEEIENMSMATTRYFRYIFQSGDNLVLLEDEIEHARIYLDIQRSRYRSALSYAISRPDHASGVKIPPLVIQTFIENAVKYAVSRERELSISITVSMQRKEDEDMAVIVIADSGPGFPSPILERLHSGESLDQAGGNRIGIMNTLQRLKLMYRERATVDFANGIDGGARVTIALPAGSD